ncbi:hypothetical protein, partial [Stenotrophomonas sp. YIM B06876]|uniref:hypothetical protein n=1 Tax=Stenotrophomonas sp. YIM B06876 TaxID=3060211 RepID=UPI002739B59D
LQLLAKFEDHVPLAGMVALGELATRTTNPLGTLIRGVTVLLSGAVHSFAWNRPYRWADLMVPVDDVALVLAGAQ